MCRVDVLRGRFRIFLNMVTFPISPLFYAACRAPYILDSLLLCFGLACIIRDLEVDIMQGDG